jgi:hypothetical protein
MSVQCAYVCHYKKNLECPASHVHTASSNSLLQEQHPLKAPLWSPNRRKSNIARLQPHSGFRRLQSVAAGVFRWGLLSCKNTTLFDSCPQCLLQSPASACHVVSHCNMGSSSWQCSKTCPHKRNFSHCCFRSELHFEKWRCAFPFHTLTLAIHLIVVKPHFITSDNATQNCQTPHATSPKGSFRPWVVLEPTCTHLEVNLCLMISQAELWQICI